MAYSTASPISGLQWIVGPVPRSGCYRERQCIQRRAHSRPLSSIAPLSETRMSGSPSDPTPTSMRSSLRTCWGISAVGKSARLWRVGEAGSDLGGRARCPLMDRAW
jgi:hypothetical protein